MVHLARAKWKGYNVDVPKFRTLIPDSMLPHQVMEDYEEEDTKGQLTRAHMWTFMATPEMFMSNTTSNAAAAWSSRSYQSYGCTSANGKKTFDGSADYGYATLAFKSINNVLRTIAR